MVKWSSLCENILPNTISSISYFCCCYFKQKVFYRIDHKKFSGVNFMDQVGRAFASQESVCWSGSPGATFVLWPLILFLINHPLLKNLRTMWKLTGWSPPATIHWAPWQPICPSPVTISVTLCSPSHHLLLPLTSLLSNEPRVGPFLGCIPSPEVAHLTSEH